MADRSATAIEIGGTITSAAIFWEIVATARGDACYTDWSDGGSKEDIANELREAAREKRSAEFSNSDKAGGMFEELEAYLQEVGLHYCQADDGCPGCWVSNRVYFHPGKGETEMGGGAEAHRPLVDLGKVLKWRADGVLDAKLDALRDAAVIPPLDISAEVLAEIEKGPPEEDEEAA